MYIVNPKFLYKNGLKCYKIYIKCLFRNMRGEKDVENN